ncbi:hypothetical protein D9M73_103390 [compost metagenome]
MSATYTKGPMKHYGFMGTIETDSLQANIFTCGVGLRPPGLSNEQDENARRLVACWNACDGLTTEQLEQGNKPQLGSPPVVLSYADIRRVEKEVTAGAPVQTNLGFLQASRKGADGRDGFAKAAMQAIYSRLGGSPMVMSNHDGALTEIAAAAYAMAEAMMKARES